MTALAGCGSCNPSAANPIISIQVLDRAPRVGMSPDVKIDRALLEARAKEAVTKWRGFKERPAKANEIGWQLTVELQLLAEEEAKEADGGKPKPGEVHRSVAVAMTLAALKSTSQSGVPARFESEALESRDVVSKDALDLLVLEAVDDAAASIRAAIELRDAKEDKVVEALRSKDRGTRSRAIVMAGQRKIKAAVPTLSELVRNDEEEPDLILKSIGALVAIGDDRAVGALIDAGRRRPPAYLGQILFAVAQLGGKEAEAYLFTVSTGHPDPEVKKNANDALEELERRKEMRQQAAQGAKEDAAGKKE